MNFRWVIFGMMGMLMIGCPSVNADEGSQGQIPLFRNLGDFHYAITTKVPLAQHYFDQGLILSFGFNHAEAERSFCEAVRLDSECAMCYWGEALVLGPNINAPMADAVVPQANAAVERAMLLMGQATEKEKALIQAVATRYAKDAPKDRSLLDKAYADAMRKVAKRFPDDPVIGALLAESLMDLHPWDFWTKRGEAKPWTPEIVSILERALEQSPDNPLANHLYIHMMEASPHPEKAILSAERLATLVPGSGHLVHMPGHIYIRVGRYRDAALANQRAVKVDQQYLSHSHAESIYTQAYVPHNYHFLWAAAVKTGQSALAMQAAQDTASKVSPEAMRDPEASATFQHFWLIPLYTKALFGNWPAILEEPPPPVDLLYPTAIWHYARGLALVRQGEVARAEQERTQLQRIIKEPSVAQLAIFELHSVATILQIADAVLAGEIASRKGKFVEAVNHLIHAIRLEDGLQYTEPKEWYLPSRQVLGAVLLEANRPVEAEQVFHEDLTDHPQNGWSLFGLEQSLLAQGKTADAELVRKQFESAWADADVMLTSSRF